MTEASFDVVALEGRDLTAESAPAGERTFGRQEEVQALIRILASGKSAVLLGPSGVGKTSIIQKLLHYMRVGRAPELTDSRIYEISTVGLCADTRYTGQQEGRIRSLLAHATRKRLLYIPDIWNLPYAGSYETNPRGIYDLMRPGVEAGKLVMFGECTPGRWDHLGRENPAFVRDFVPIVVRETTEEETRDLLIRAAAELPQVGPHITFEKQAIDRIHALAKKFMPTMSFPGKGVDVLRRVALDARPTSGPARAAPIDVAFVEDVFSQLSGLPLHMISPRVRMTYEEMHTFLSERVLGQPEAVTAVADLLALYKTGLNDPNQPAGTVLFVGPTGVGKTELAKATAEFLFGTRDRLFRVDMSEYKDFHSFEKLIGDPRKGTTGFLTDHVRKHPFSVVLLDEFDKGHANIADLFLQVFDDGRLTDATGETIDFRNTILILTTNIGSNMRELNAAIGFAEKHGTPFKDLAREARRALEATYRPEFLNRIDRILVFHPLRKDDMRRIAQRELGKVYQREGLLERDLLLEIDEGVLDLLLDRGFDPKYGARPLKRAIEELLVLPLARSVLSAEWSRFQLLRVARKGDGVILSFEDTDQSRKLQNLERRMAVDDGEGKIVRMSLGDVRKALAGIYERFARLEEVAAVESMRKELADLEEKAQHPAFWEEAFGKEGGVVRRHRLAVEVRRIDDLKGRAELVRKLVEASFVEAEDAVADDLLKEYVRLDRQLRRAERELVRFDEKDRGDCRLIVRAVGGKAGAITWAKDLAKMYEGWATDRKYDVEVATKPHGQEVIVRGPYAFGYLKGERGGHRLIAPPPGKHDKRGDTFLARVEVLPIMENLPKAPKSTDDEPPVRTYDIWRSRGVHDRRTGHSEGDVKRILSGKIDAFIEAAVDL